MTGKKIETLGASSILVFFILSLMPLLLMPVNAGGIIPISHIEKHDRGTELTVSGVITAVLFTNSSSHPHKEPEPGDAMILTLDDSSGRVLVYVDPTLWVCDGGWREGQRIVVTGLYAGNGGLEGLKGTIFADQIRTLAFSEFYQDREIKELLNSPERYFQAGVRIRGTVKRVEIEPDGIALTIEDESSPSSQIEVVSRSHDTEKEAEGLSPGDEVVVEGEFMRNMIYAFAIHGEEPESEVNVSAHTSPTPVPSPSASPSPLPVPVAAPTPTSGLPSLPPVSIPQQSGTVSKLLQLISQLRELVTHPDSLATNLNRLKTLY